VRIFGDAWTTLRCGLNNVLVMLVLPPINLLINLRPFMGKVNKLLNIIYIIRVTRMAHSVPRITYTADNGFGATD
jgi:hypothetical protein